MSREVVKWSILDQRLLECAANNMSPEQIEAELDIDGASAVIRIRELLRSRDIWDELERKKLLLESLYNLKSNFEKAIDYSDAKHIEAMTRLLTQLGDRLDAQMQFTDAQLDKVTTIQAQKLLQLFVLATERAKEILSESYPEGLMDDVDAALQSGLRDAAGMIESAE